MFKGKVVAGSLDVVVSLLADPDWREKAESVTSVSELRQILISFCEAKGEVIPADKDTLWVHVSNQTKDNVLISQ
jgi:hypothetical protein